MAKLFTAALSALALRSAAAETCGVDEASMLQQKPGVSQREAIEKHRAELEQARTAVSAAEAEAIDLRIRMMDSALKYEHDVDEFRSVAAQLHDGRYAAFPAGDAFTALAEESIQEEIEHNEKDESFVLNLEDVDINDANRDLVKHLVEEWLLDGEFSAEALQADPTAPINDIDDAEFKARMSQSLEDLELSKSTLNDMLDDAKLARSGGGTYALLRRFHELNAIAKSSLKEELRHEQLREVWLQRLSALPAGDLRERVAKTAVLSLLSSDDPDLSEVPIKAEVPAGPAQPDEEIV